MTPTATPLHRELPDSATWPLVATASAIGAVLTALLVTVAALVTSGGVLDDSGRAYLIAGALAGAAAGALGNLVVARGALRRIGGPAASADFVRALVLDFAVQTLAVVGGTLVVRFWLAVKFQDIAAFGMTLAGTVVLFRIPGTLLVSRALGRRARSIGGAAAAMPAAQDSN